MFCFLVFYYVGGPLNLDYFAISSYIMSISDFILNLSLFILFVYKIKNKDSMEGMEISDDVSFIGAANHDLNDDKKAIWNVMIKHCVIFGIIMFSNQLFYIIAIIDEKAFGFIAEESLRLIVIYTVRSIGNVITIGHLWLVLKINNSKYVYFCKCWHSCILRYCMKEDPNIIREGFIIEDKHEPLLIGNCDNEVEGHDSMQTNATESETGDNEIKGHSLVDTKFYSL